MRLLCVRGANKGELALTLTGTRVVVKDEEIYEGDYYTKTGYFTDSDGTWFFLAERPVTASYNANRFIPLSNIDETEMVREYQTEKV